MTPKSVCLLLVSFLAIVHSGSAGVIARHEETDCDGEVPSIDHHDHGYDLHEDSHPDYDSDDKLTKAKNLVEHIKKIVITDADDAEKVVKQIERSKKDVEEKAEKASELIIHAAHDQAESAQEKVARIEKATKIKIDELERKQKILEEQAQHAKSTVEHKAYEQIEDTQKILKEIKDTVIKAKNTADNVKEDANKRKKEVNEILKRTNKVVDHLEDEVEDEDEDKKNGYYSHHRIDIKRVRHDYDYKDDYPGKKGDGYDLRKPKLEGYKSSDHSDYEYDHDDVAYPVKKRDGHDSRNYKPGSEHDYDYDYKYTDDDHPVGKKNELKEDVEKIIHDNVELWKDAKHTLLGWAKIG